jgi:hypothetical protein
LIMIPFNPHHFNVALGIRQLADVAEKLPVIFGEPPKIQVGKNVTQQNQPPEAGFLEHPHRFLGTADVRSQVQIGQDERVVGCATHQSFL